MLEARGVGAAETVDRLIGIADDAEVGRREQRQQAILLVVDVLELVDRDRAPALAQARGEAGVGRQRAHRQRDEIVEVDEAAHGERIAIGRQDFFHVVGGRAEAALRLGDRAQRPFGLEQRDVERLREQRRALGLARDPEAAIEAGGAGVLAQDRQSERMEGGNRHPPGLVRQEADEPLAQLRGGAAGEGDGKAAFGGDAALGDQVRDPMGQRAGLAGAGTGDDHQRPVPDLRRRALIGVELRQDAGVVPS